MRFASYLRLHLLSVCLVASSLGQFGLQPARNFCSMVSTNATRLPVVFVSHGGGPSFFMDARPGDRFYDISKGSESAKALERLPKELGAEKPNAIVIVTAHWEGSHKVLVSGKSEYTKLLYDYGGFPDFTYKLEYKAPAQPQLAKRITELLNNKGLSSELDTTRNWDHGVFIPLKVMYPNADIPVVAVSILQSYDPEVHINIGKALAPLRDEGVLIIGSGYATHNFAGVPAANTKFINAASDIITNATPELREKSFLEWEKLPGARDAHRQEDHLMPLHVVIGAAGQDKGKTMYRKDTLNGLFIFCNWAFGLNN
eukprot:Phypoly_transcript_12897.p1 GENE.Phypoly_transcript_12897~~Phypoly_transcript_12897.p1  ORF type:complete len:314 (+),score=50.31 Phypoly_transcript_12897:116-1057(+)